MRTATAILSVLSLSLMLTVPARAEETQLVKVYRDYPGYINPAVCENPNLVTPSAGKPAAETAEAPHGTRPSPVATVPAPPSAGQPATETPGSALPVVADPPAASDSGVVAPAAAMTGQCEPAPFSMQSADPVGVPYLSVWGGVVATRDTDADPDVDVTFDNGYGLGLAVGYDFGPARVEIEASHRESNVDEVTVNGKKVASDGDLEVQSLMVNGFADFGTGGNLTPYVGAGIGYAEVDLGHDDDTVLAGQLAAGVLVAVTPAVAIDIGYRFMMTEDPNIGGADYEARQHTVLVGLQIRF